MSQVFATNSTKFTHTNTHSHTHTNTHSHTHTNTHKHTHTHTRTPPRTTLYNTTNLYRLDNPVLFGFRFKRTLHHQPVTRQAVRVRHEIVVASPMLRLHAREVLPQRVFAAKLKCARKVIDLCVCMCVCVCVCV